MNNPLNDKEFLKQLDLDRNKEIYIKIYNLNFEEQPREEIVGKVTAGSINIDGTSAVRRTCSLTLVADEININDYLWALNTKIKILIGIRNTINSKYDDIIWFNQGIFILTTFNVSYTTNNYTIQLSGQDKMCLLNGTVGGILPASIDFKQETFASKTYETVSFGPQYFPGIYYIADNYSFQLDSRDIFTENEKYFERIYDTYYPFSFLSEDEFNEEIDDIYVENEELFLPCTADDWDFEKKQPKVTLYQREVLIDDLVDDNDGDGDEVRFLRVSTSNNVLLEDLTHYYKSNKYIPYTGTVLDDFLEYYEKDENNFFKKVILDNETFDKNKIYYIDNSFRLVNKSNEYFDENVQYYKKQKGKYEIIDLTNKSYKPNSYFILYVYHYKKATEEFDSNNFYFQKDEATNSYTLIDFLSQAEYDYRAGQYYLLQGNEYVLSKDEYNPENIYWQLNEFSSLEDIPIKTIIKEAVHTYGQEPYYNIVINDLDDYGLLLKEYRGTEPLFLLVKNGICENILTSAEQECYLVDPKLTEEQLNIYQTLFEDELIILNNRKQKGEISNTQYEEGFKQLFNTFKEIVSINPKATNDPLLIGEQDYITYDTYIDEFNIAPSKIFFESKNYEQINIYTVLRLDYGDAAGYEQKDLTYPEDLISSIGDSLTSVLDKIVDKLQDFEYFYDLDGRFVFQRKKIYFNKSWNNIITNVDSNETYVENAAYTSEVQYTFENNDLITSIQNSPKLDNIKNDYSVWGVRKTLSGTEVPIHARYAIDKKPYCYVTFPKTKFNYVTNKDELITERFQGTDYLVQEIYVNNEFTDEVLMDYFYRGEDLDVEESHYDVFEFKVRIEPIKYKTKNLNDETVYPGILYKYILCDWREVIYQMALDYYKHNQENNFLALVSQNNTFSYDDDFGSDFGNNSFLRLLIQNAGKLYPSGTTGYEPYYVDLYSFWRDIYNPNPEVEIGYVGGYYDKDGNWIDVTEDYTQFNCKYFLPESDYEKYAQKIKDILAKYKEKIDELEKIIKNYSNNTDYAEIMEQIEQMEKELKELQDEKSLLLKNYIADNMVVVNDDEYLQLQEQYRLLQQDKNSALEDLEEEIISILEDSFGLY